MHFQRFQKQNIFYHNDNLSDSFPIACYEFTQHATNASYMHYHNEFELGLCVSGSGLFFIDGHAISFKQGDVSFIFPGQPHIAHSPNDLPSKWYFIPVDIQRILFKESLLTARLMASQDYLPNIFPSDLDNCISTLIQLIISELSKQKTDYKIVIEQLLTTLITILLRYQSANYEVVPTKSSDFVKISPALNYIYKFYFEDLNIPELATLCHLSETHFRDLFKKVTGISPLRYLNLIRMKMAKTLLKSSSISVLEISLKVGFNNISSFNRTFKNLYGMSPLSYRKTGL